MSAGSENELDATYILDFEHIEVCPEGGSFDLSAIREYFRTIRFILPDPLNPCFFYVCPWLEYIKTQWKHRLTTGRFHSYVGALVLSERQILIKTDVTKEEGELVFAFLQWLVGRYCCSIKNDCGTSITLLELAKVLQLDAGATDR